MTPARVSAGSAIVRSCLVLTVALALIWASTVPADAQAASPSSYKLAFFNIQSGKGSVALPGAPSSFVNTMNCTDPSAPINAWGAGVVQRELIAKVGDDPAVVAPRL